MARTDFVSDPFRKPTFGRDADIREKLEAHIDEFCSVFNKAMDDHGLDMQIDGEEQKALIRAQPSSVLKHMEHAVVEHGIHPEQLETAAEAIARTVNDPGRSGLILGALQSGKTGTAFSMLFAAPIHYMISGEKYVPLFMTTNQKNHLDQTRLAMHGFFDLYGNLKLRRTGEFDEIAQRSLIEHYAEAGNDFAIVDGEPYSDPMSLRDYTDGVMGDLYPGEDSISKIVEALTFKRVQGREISSIESYCNMARERGYAVMMLIDEPQFGASAATTRRSGVYKECLMSQIFERIDGQFFDTRSPNFFVGLSATPFDTYGMKNFFRIHQKLGYGYIGPNGFDGRAIDPNHVERLPEMESFSEISKRPGLKHFEDIAYLLGNTTETVKGKESFKITNPDGTKRNPKGLELLAHGVDILRTVIDSEVLPLTADRSEEEGPVGALLRISNTNSRTDLILSELELDDTYNVIKLYGRESGNDASDVKRRIWEATRNDKRPYLVVVVGKGRMGDAFPASCEVGIDLTQNPADQNSVLQGTFGRMCGYKKRSKVIFSNRAKEMVMDYCETKGKSLEASHSRHTTTIRETASRNRPVQHLMLFSDMLEAEPKGSPLAKLLEAVNEHLEELSEVVTTSKTVPSVRRRKDDDNRSRNLEFPRLMREEGLGEYIAHRIPQLDPSWKEAPEVLPIGATVGYKGGEERITYMLDGDDRCEALVRGRRPTKDEDRNVGRAQRERRAPRGADFKHAVLPVIMVKKVDLEGNTLPLERLDEPGRFVLDAISLQLKEPVRRVFQADFMNLPSPTHAMAGGRSEDQKVLQLVAALGQQVVGRIAKRKADLDLPEIVDRIDDKAGEMLWSDIRFQRLLESLYNPETHLYRVDGGVITFFRREGGEEIIDNPNGPAVLTYLDRKKIHTSHYVDGVRVKDMEENRQMRIEKAPEEDMAPSQRI